MENGASSNDGPSRRMLNCIVDDTALIAGTKKSTRDGFRKWIANGSVRLLVPLNSLSQVDRLKNGHARINSDARDVLQWLDDVTSSPDAPVRLQGMDEYYQTWAEVQSFMLPQTLLSEKEGSEVDSLVDDMESSFQITDNSSDRASMSSIESSELVPKTPSSPRSAYSAASPETSHATLATDQSPRQISGSFKKENMTSKNDLHVPMHLQPLFNHTLWLIHHVDASHGSFVFVSNDDKKQAIAQRFGIRTKRIEQLREIVAREERDFRNRSNAYQKAKATIPIPAPVQAVVPPADEEDSDDEEEVVFKRPQRTTQAKGSTSPVAAPVHVPAPVAPTAPAAHRVYDPNSFGRGAHGPGFRGGRGRGGRGGLTAVRGNFGPAPAPVRQQVAHDPNKPIDPDSYARPPPSVRTLRAGKHRLWNPT